jgi:hypothetical protein
MSWFSNYCSFTVRKGRSFILIVFAKSGSGGRVADHLVTNTAAQVESLEYAILVHL